MNTITRRTFLKQSTALAAGAAAFHVATDLRGQSANEKFTLGIIGPGGMGTSLLNRHFPYGLCPAFFARQLVSSTAFYPL